MTSTSAPVTRRRPRRPRRSSRLATAATVSGARHRGPETVAAHFAALAEAGYTDVIVRQMMPDQALALASISRLGEVRERVAEA